MTTSTVTAQPLSPKKEEWKNYLILAVDDEMGILAYIKNTLVLGGFSVITAKSGEEGLELLKDQPIKLIISDQMMPGGMRGTDFLRQAKELYPDIITVILSAYKDSEHVIAALNDARTFYYLTKPCEKEELINRTSQALRHYHAGALKKQQEDHAHAVMMETEKMANLGTYSGGVIHNLKNVLMPLVAFCDSIRREAEDVREHNQEKSHDEFYEDRGHNIVEMSSFAEQAVGDASSTIESLMSLYRSKPNETESFDLAQVIENAVRLEKTRKESRGIEIHVEKKGIDFKVEGLRGILSSMILEFLKNANYAIAEKCNQSGKSPHGNIWITLEDCQIPEMGEAVRFSIRDTGCGMGEDVQKDIFTPLFTTKAEAGTGLGLSVAYEIIQAHGGCIALKSAIGEGTTFTVTLPKEPKGEVKVKSLS